MILEKRDFEIMTLAGKYRWLPYGCFDRYGLAGYNREVDMLAAAALFSISRSREYFSLTSKGYSLLSEQGRPYEPSAKRAFRGSSFLRRRLETASAAFACLRAGIDVFRDDPAALREQPVFFPALSLRGGKGNLMNAANCSGFSHFGGKAYMIEYVSSENIGMYPVNELSHLHNLASVFDVGMKTPTALIFAGESYRDIYGHLQKKDASKRHKVKGFSDFWSVYERADIPIHLLSCNELGAMQLMAMSEVDANEKIARASFGAMWEPRDSDIPEADGRVAGAILVIALDMNVRRVLRICAAAKELGRHEVMVAALAGQMRTFYMDILPKGGLVTPLSIGHEVLESAFGKKLALYGGDPSPAPSARGGYIYV